MLKVPASKDVYVYWKLPLLPDYIKKWATICPQGRALISADTGRIYNYQEYDEINTLYSMKLIEMGVKKGDVVAVQMSAVPEFYFMMMACASIGAIMATIDIELQPQEAIHQLNQVNPAAFFGQGKAPVPEFAASFDFNECFSEAALKKIEARKDLLEAARQGYASLSKRDPHIIIYTGASNRKPAVVCHEGTIVNAQIALRGVGLYGSNWLGLNAVSASDVNGTLQTGAIWIGGGCLITMPTFDPAEFLTYVEKYKPTQISLAASQYRKLWDSQGYDKYDISSLRCIGYQDGEVDKPFLERLSSMAPTWYTGYGTAECSGYISITPKGAVPDEVLGQVGQTFPDLGRVSVREPMNSDRTAGKALPVGEIGEICVEGPLVFLGYYNDQKATDAIKSKEGILYLGKKGCLHDYGNYRGLRFA